ncbi:uncharacterized protein LOC117643676 isoform X2 [Thrips palmi]|uniref:Uncharacterized protein LOC117643676 isoform X2 n=1 Tax=Thrips palmi TaxID=161013 RepID=A0A6P8ZLB9_THRPL|nr:uncharacterized protein LOC117643676 isoform X2 [Thrips palmi]
MRCLPRAQYKRLCSFSREVNAIVSCSRNDTASDLNQCISRGIEHFLRTAKNGLPDIGLPSLDPFMVKHLTLKEGSGKVAVSFDFHDVRFKGFSGAEVYSARMNVNDKKLEVSLRAPVYEVDGFYSCEGAVYELPLSSNGRFTVTMTDVTSAWMLYFLAKTANNDTMLAANRFIVDVSPANVVYRFDKKFDGENNLGIGEAMDEFMNENALEIYNIIKPQIMKIMGGKFLELANQVLMNYPSALDLASK